MEISVKSFSNAAAASSSVSLSEAVYGYEPREDIVHQVVVSCMTNSRAGTKAQKSRKDVSGGGKKPFKQKGTGRARAGTTRGPIWRGGGVTFAARPKTYSKKINKKLYACAIKSVFSELLRTERLIVIDDLSVTSSKTKDLVKQLTSLELNDVFIITEELNPSLELAARNLYWVGLSTANVVNLVSLLSYKKVLITAQAAKKIEERLK